MTSAFARFNHLNRKEYNTMSHFTEIKTQIKDIEALRSALQEMGLPLLQEAEARGFYESKTKGEYVIRLKGPYDVALNKQKDGTFGLTADFWDGHVEAEVGTGYGKLLQLYGVHKTLREARRRGLMVNRSQQRDGSIRLSIGGM
jgi:hypothetical protein